MDVCCECCVLSGRGLCDGLITRPEESYRLWCVAVCGIETWSMRSQTSFNCDWTYINRRYITGCISCIQLIVTVKHNCWMSSDRLQCTMRGGMFYSYNGQTSWFYFAILHNPCSRGTVQLNLSLCVSLTHPTHTHTHHTHTYIHTPHTHTHTPHTHTYTHTHHTHTYTHTHHTHTHTYTHTHTHT